MPSDPGGTPAAGDGAPGSPPILRSWIDEPSGTIAASPGICLRGWCFDDGDRRITAVRARLGRRVVAGRCGLARPDVKAALNGPASSAESGFILCVRLAPGRTLVQLEAEIPGAGWILFHELELANDWPASLRYPFRLARFWAGALLGRPGAWNRLNPAEQGFIFARIEEKEDGHPLRLSPHHPPRAVALERFSTRRRPTQRLPKLTLVTPSFQQGAYLEATLRSVLDQEGVRLDYIVQDGASTDGTVEVLRRYAPRLKAWASEPDHGQGDALRRGFARMEAEEGEIMAYLNSDDLLMPGAARFVADYFARHPEVDVVYGHRVLIDEAGQEVGRWFAPRRSCDDLRLQDLVPQETLFWRKRIWDKVGGVDPSFQFAIDWDLLLRFAAAGARMARLPWFLGLFRLHPHQKSQARLEEVGIPEMDRLRERSLGRVPTRAELVASMQRAQIDSTLLRTWMRRGWRL